MLSQLQVLNRVIETKDFSIISKNNLNVEYFFDYKAVFDFIKNHVSAYGFVPDKETVVNSFPEFDLIEVREPNEYLISALLEDYKTCKLGEMFNYVKTAVERGDDATKTMSTIADAIQKLNTQSASLKCTDITTDFSRYDRYLDRIEHKDDYYISTGLIELDKIIGGIDARDENMIIAARTGIGKSWCIMIMAAAAARQNKTVGIYSGEMSVDKVATRIDTILGNAKRASFSNSDIMKGNDFAQVNYKNYLEQLKEWRQSGTLGSIKILTPNDINGPATVDALRAFIEREHLDILFIDQYSLLEDTSNAKIEHERVANISKAVKNLQVMKKIPIISVSQNNRSGEKDKDGKIIQDTTQIALSDRIGQDATTIIMLSRKKNEDTKQDFLQLNIIKARDGGDGNELTYIADFNNGRFTYVQDADSEKEADELLDHYSVNSEGAAFE
jgi:replicative DNA helicase